MIFRSDLPEFVTNGLFAFTSEDFLTFPSLVSLGHLKFLGDLHGGKDFTFANQGDLFTNFDRGGVGSRNVEGDRYRPEGAVGHLEFLTNALPVSFGHETGKRAETTDTHHDQIAFGTGGDLNLLESCGFLEFCITCTAFE